MNIYCNCNKENRRWVKCIPPMWSTKDFILLDICIETEIKILWDLGVITDNCCCGHSIEHGFIGVINGKSKKIMDSLNYVPFIHPKGYLYYYYPKTCIYPSINKYKI